EEEYRAAAVLRREVDLDAAVALAVARERDGAADVDAERLQPLEVLADPVARVDDRRAHGPARGPAVALRHVAGGDRVGIEVLLPLDLRPVGEGVVVDRELDRAREREEDLARVDLDLPARVLERPRDELRADGGAARARETRGPRELEEQRSRRRSGR